MKPFESFLAPQLEEYITYRQSLGYAKNPLLSYLKILDRYVKSRNIDQQTLQPFFFLEFRSNLAVEARTVNRILSSTRVFFQYLLRRGLYTQNPLQDVPPLRENAIVPFVFSPEQVDQLLSALCKGIRKDRTHFLTDMAIYVALLLLARCGMRISEPLRLLTSHYRPDDGTIYIEKTKFKKDRLIPVPKVVLPEIENYLAVRKSLNLDDQNPYLLAGLKQRALRDYQIRSVFHKAVREIGLSQQRQIIDNVNFSAPTPHSLRHSFAVNTLKRIKDRGKSPQNALPVLAVYMGHSEYRHTIKYLKVIDTRQRQGMVEFITSHQGKR